MSYKKFEDQTQRMIELMKYRVDESKFNGTKKPSRLEYSIKAADGKTYGIVNEGTKFYIKVAPNKHTELLTEDFDYIGGENNKKYNEYKSYSAASKNLELKLMQINESNKSNKIEVTPVRSELSSEWQINETKEMRASIERMNQISRNVSAILNENCVIPSSHTLPEAPAKNPSEKKRNAPYKINSKCNPNEVKSEEDHINAGGNPFTEKPKCSIKENEVLAWNEDEDYLDLDGRSHIGSSNPYGEDCKDDDEVFVIELNTLEEDDEHIEDIAGFEGLYDNEEDDDDAIFDVEDDDVPFPDALPDDDEYITLSEDALDYFGKHPAYNVEPMTLPELGEDPEGTVSWDDESVDSREGYGTERPEPISPYEELTQAITESVMEELGFSREAI